MKSKKRIRSTYPERESQVFMIKEAASASGISCEVVSVRDAKNRLSSLLDKAANGERIVITSDGRPKAMIVSYKPMTGGSKWKSREAIRKLSICEDSTQILRDERDSGY
jgi:prevent-host-death family protein